MRLNSKVNDTAVALSLLRHMKKFENTALDVSNVKFTDN